MGFRLVPKLVTLNDLERNLDFTEVDFQNPLSPESAVCTSLPHFKTIGEWAAELLMIKQLVGDFMPCYKPLELDRIYVLCVFCILYFPESD